MITTASNPSRLHFGVCYQYDIEDESGEDFETNMAIKQITTNYQD
jgi:hypothetical protein